MNITRRDGTATGVRKTIFRLTADRQEQDQNVAEDQVPEQQRGCEKQTSQTKIERSVARLSIGPNKVVPIITSGSSTTLR